MRGMLQRLSKRTKAALFILALVPMEVLAALFALGVWPSLQALSIDPTLVAVALLLLAFCDVLAAYMTFYLKVTPRAAEAKTK